MPLQKNSGNKKAKKEAGVATKNRRFVSNLLDDLRSDEKVDDIHIARVMKKLGNGRVEVFYVTKLGDTDDTMSHTKQALIKGTFRGKGKHSVWIETGSIVAVADTGLGLFEIMAVLTRDQVKDISKEIDIDPRILNGDEKVGNDESGGYEFEEEREEEVIVVEQKPKAKTKKLIEKEELSDGDIDNI